jgi:hypothetical protein
MEGWVSSTVTTNSGTEGIVGGAFVDEGPDDPPPPQAESKTTDNNDVKIVLTSVFNAGLHFELNFIGAFPFMIIATRHIQLLGTHSPYQSAVRLRIGNFFEINFLEAN